MDLRVEDHPDPLGELRRLRRACGAPTSEWTWATSWPPRATSMARSTEYEAAHRSQPDNLELAFWHGVALAANGREEEAAPILRQHSRRTRAGSSCSSGCPPRACSPTTAS